MVVSHARDSRNSIEAICKFNGSGTTNTLAKADAERKKLLRG